MNLAAGSKVVHKPMAMSSTRTGQLLDGKKRSDEVEPALEDDPPPRRYSRLSALTFHYFQGVMSVGRQRPLQTEDLPSLDRFDSAKHIGPKFAANLKRHGTVARALVATLWRPFFVACLCKLPHDCCIFISPMLLRMLIKQVEAERPVLSDGLLVVGGIFVSGLVQTFCLQQYFHRVYRTSYNSMAALNTAIYDKALVLSGTERTNHPIGQTVNLVSVDVETISSLYSYFQTLLWSAQFQIFVSMYMLFGLLGKSINAGIVCMLTLMFLNIKVLKRVKAAQAANLVAKDDRLKAVTEVMRAMRVVKILALEPRFVTKIHAAREREFGALCRTTSRTEPERSTPALSSLHLPL